MAEERSSSEPEGGAMPKPPRRARGPRVVALLLASLALSAVVGGIVLTRSQFMRSRRALVEGWSAPAETLQPSEDRLAAILKSARTYALQREAGKAEAIFKEAIAQFPQTRALHLGYAEFLMAEGRAAEAYPHYETALAVGPATAEAEFAAGVAAGLASRPERAVEHFAGAQALAPGDTKVALYLGQAQMKLGQDDAARATLVRALKLDEDLAIAWGMLAEISLKQNSPVMALQHIEKARALEPRSLAWRLIEARAHRRGNEPRKALEVLAGASDEEKASAAVARLMSECFGMLSRPADAAAVLARASDAAPDSAGLALEAAAWFERAGIVESAKAYAERAAGLGDAKAAQLLERLSVGG